MSVLITVVTIFKEKSDVANCSRHNNVKLLEQGMNC